MRRKPIFPKSIEDLKRLSTKALLARLNRLQQCEQSYELSDKKDDDLEDETQMIVFKDSEIWKTAYCQIKNILSQREHVEKGEQLQKKRHTKAHHQKTSEHQDGRMQQLR